jgi:outer membrane protein
MGARFTQNGLSMNSTFRFPSLCATTLAMCLAAAPVWAGGPDHDEGKGPHMGLGLGVVSEASPYRGVGTDTKVVPVFMFENSHVRLFGPNLDLKLPSAGPMSFALTAKYSDKGYQASDAAELQGMAERKDGFWLGATARWNTPWAELSARALGDASNRSGGQQLELEASRGFGLGRGMRLEPHLALTWLDSSYVDYYYGVGPGEAKAGRAAYTGTSTVNTELGLRLKTNLAPGHMVMMDLKHTFLGSGIKNSPLVDRSGVSTVFVAYVHQF